MRKKQKKKKNWEFREKTSSDGRCKTAEMMAKMGSRQRGQFTNGKLNMCTYHFLALQQLLGNDGGETTENMLTSVNDDYCFEWHCKDREKPKTRTEWGEGKDRHTVRYQ
eukprot:TRINITY_DN239_c0_g1_i2.p3 TRINITY_DN239_c0_g1~~TRINITY_DN239_c0_g1_i2.p3  ORF type:complete len:109 (+),score=2.80 TRINITY_DN239_c0_g1_i2:380-706(+)